MATTATADADAVNRTGRAHPEAGLVAAAGGGSDDARVKLCIRNVYNSHSSEVVNVGTSSTVGQLKKLIQDAFDTRPAPHQQRLIFRGKQCEESQQLGHVLRGVDLSAEQNMHLVVTQPVGQNPVSPAALVRTPTNGPASTQVRSAVENMAQPPQQPRPPSADDSSASGVSSGGATNPPQRIELNADQMAQLQSQYQQMSQQQQQRYRALSRESVVLAQQQWLGAVRPREQQQHQPHRFQWRAPAALEAEVSTSVATRALGGNMPGPAAGGAVRDITGIPPADFTPAAGIGENGEGGRANLVDPAPRVPDVRREARGWLKIMMQCMLVIVVFGLDADGWMLVLLAIGGLVAVMFRTGLLEVMLGGGQEGGGLWKTLCTSATVIREGGGLVADARFLCSTLFLSLFPSWKPVRSPEAIAAEAAARAAALATQAEATASAAAQRVEAEDAVQEEVAGNDGDPDTELASPGQGSEEADGVAIAPGIE